MGVSRVTKYTNGNSIEIDFRDTDPYFEMWFLTMIDNEIDDSMNNITHCPICGANAMVMNKYIDFLKDIRKSLVSVVQKEVISGRYPWEPYESMKGGH